MPYLNIRIASEESPEQTEKTVELLMAHTGRLLGKKADVTAIEVSYVSPKNWFVGGVRVSELQGTTFYLDIKITEGSNTKSEKSAYVHEVFKEMESILGPISLASYIVIHDIRGDSWGYQGDTQEFRFIRAKVL